MGLIDTTTLTLHYVNDSEDAKYAILSHVWRPGNEVTFQEFRNGDGKHKPGYAKIVNTCKLALSHGHPFAWVDTCCINKESSAELSEAINSMWRWYYGAAVCYAYLEDVHSDVHIMDDVHRDEWASSGRAHNAITYEPFIKTEAFDVFRSSRWFARGWTLQELIAPRMVHFYNVTWSYIGNKAKMLQHLSSITTIDTLALADRDKIGAFVAARKLSWASRRSTTRVEDQAYSLLGLMGINMPLLYGESHRAFVRLQEEIIRTSSDQSIFAWDTFSHGLWSDQDRLFALKPDQFRGCSKMVEWKNHLDKEHRLTNTGVTFDGLYIDEGSQLILLNCRYEDDFRGPIALCVQRVPQLQDVWLVSGELQRRVVYHWSNPQVRRVSLRRFESYPHERDTPQLKLQLCRHPASSEAFRICNAWPQASWNYHTGVMSGAIVEGRIHGHQTPTVLLQAATSGMQFWLRVRLVRCSQADQLTINRFGQDIRVDVALSDKSLEELRDESNQEVAVLMRSVGRARVSAAPQRCVVKRFGDDVLNIDICIGDHMIRQREEPDCDVFPVLKAKKQDR